MAETKKAKGGKKNRKLGRNVNLCKAYAAAGLELRNRRRRMMRAIRRFPENAILLRDFDKIFGAGAAKIVLANRTAAQVRRAARRAQRKKLEEQRKGQFIVLDVDVPAEACFGA